MTLARNWRRARRNPAGIAALLAAFSCPVVAWSHTQIEDLGEPAASTDFYQVTCSNDGSGPPASLRVEVLDTAPIVAALVGVQLQRGSLAKNSTDAVDGDGAPSPAITLNGAAGVFDVLVYKTASGVDGYTLSFHCYTGPNGSGDHTGTGLTTKQDQ
jgi:hypothetical protein